MKFKEAFEEMKSGIPVKLPSWAGYWWRDEESQTILMYTKDGGCLQWLDMIKSFSHLDRSNFRIRMSS